MRTFLLKQEHQIRFAYIVAIVFILNFIFRA
jgi:hypothetical protein